MDNTQDMLKRLKSMSDTELASAIEKVARSLGANDKMTARLTADRQKLRTRLEGTSEKELNKVLSLLSSDQLEGIAKSLRETGDGNGSK